MAGEYKTEPGSLAIDTRVSYTDEADRPATGVIVGYRQWGYQTLYLIRPDGTSMAECVQRERNSVQAI